MRINEPVAPGASPTVAHCPRRVRRRLQRLHQVALLGGFCLLLAACERQGSEGRAATGPDAATGDSPSAAAPAGAASATEIHYATVAHAALGQGASTRGDLPFPASNPINTDISQLPVDPNSDALIASIGLSTGLHPDFGAFRYGVPYVIVDQRQALVKLSINAGGYPNESDSAPMPIPPDAPVEGGDQPGGDRHVLVIDRFSNMLYELLNAAPAGRRDWSADQSSIFDLTSNDWRPAFTGKCDVTSADAAGLPIFPLLVRYDEVESGVVRHALRMSVRKSRKAYLPPAQHWASNSTSPDLPPMGMRVRLKASYPIPGTFSKESQVLLKAMKTYGLIVADNGSNWFFTGATDPRWVGENDLIHRMVSEFRQVTGANFEVVKMTGIVTPSSCR